MTGIILVEYYLERRQYINLSSLYNEQKQQSIKWNAPIALLIGAAAALIQVDLSWLVGFAAGGLAYIVLNRLRKEARELPEEEVNKLDVDE